MSKGHVFSTTPHPVIAQPGIPILSQVAMVTPLSSIPGCPPGLEYLAQLDQVMIEQQVELLEVLTGFECRNKFRILNNMGQQIYFAMEESGLCMRICCGPARGFTFHITDNTNQEVMRVRREFRCCKGCYCCPCTSCYYYASVEDRNGQLLGYVSNMCFCCKPLFGVFDNNNHLMAEIRGPCCPCQTICCTCDKDFPVVELNGNSQIGTLTKVWSGVFKNMCTKADNFRVTFPANLPVQKKALMIGAVFIIDMMIYEQNNNN